MLFQNMWLGTILVTLSTSAICLEENTPQIVVETDYGKVKGTTLETRKGRTVYAFLGIPYAEPPTGTLRFQPPIAKKPWRDTLDCTKSRQICLQEDYFAKSGLVGSEDCLYLNVYSPKLQGENRFPVMIYIHGGAFAMGNGNLEYIKPVYLLDKDIVLVAFNYRLGPLGFLSTGDEIIPGNNGLKDQNFAIRWVKKNVHKFGGDSEKIVIFGLSTGAASVHLQMLSPLSKGLFYGAISESGNAVCPFAVDTLSEVVSNSKKLAKILNCTSEFSQQMLDCLKVVKADKIVIANRKFSKWDIEPTIRFRPVVEPNVEGAFLTEHPVDIIISGKSLEIPWIVGTTTEDGAIRATGIYNNLKLVKELDEKFNQIAPILLLYPKDDTISNKIREFYFQNGTINNSTRFSVINMYTDGRYFSGTHEAVRLYTRYTKNPVYYYLFGYRGTASYSGQYGDPSENYGVCHGDETLYLYPGDDSLKRGKRDIFDEYYTDLMSTLWANFATTLNPTINAPSHLIPSVWHPATAENMDCLYLGHDIHMAKNLRENRALFWRSLNLHRSNCF